MRNIFKIGSALLLAATMLVSCHKDLDRFPPNTQTGGNLYSTEEGYKGVLAKMYGAMALTGNSGPAGSGDVAGIDEGTSDFLRLYWKAQELSTDEAVVAWNDVGIQDFHRMNWGSNNPMLNGLYNRSFYVIALSNEFIRESAPDKIAAKGLNAATIKVMRAEARFVRAYQYSVLMDLFGNPGFVDESTVIGTTDLPKQILRADLFAFIEKELLEIEADLAAPKANEYGRADKAASWSLLSRLYLNSQVYTGKTKWTEAATFAKKVIDANYQLTPNYSHNFLADNNVGNQEFIWTLNYDGQRTRSFGGTTFLVNGSVNGDNTKFKDTSGLSGWSGIRTTKALVELFAGAPTFGTRPDKRALFFMEGQNLEIGELSKFTEGYGVIKYRNRKKDNSLGNDPERTYSDIDFPVFRLAEMYLNYAEAVARGGTGDAASALTYVNALRQRAYGNNTGNVNASTLVDLNFFLEERGRELYWEAQRRTDLIRFGKFTGGNYIWPWKGGVASGTGVASFRTLYPIPTTEVSSNSNIKQNSGY